jgi:Ca2+-binding EF-hand superfamily protein
MHDHFYGQFGKRMLNPRASKNWLMRSLYRQDITQLKMMSGVHFMLAVVVSLLNTNSSMTVAGIMFVFDVRDYDGKVTAEEVAAAAMFLKDSLDKESVHELLSNLAKDPGKYPHNQYPVSLSMV